MVRFSSSELLDSTNSFIDDDDEDQYIVDNDDHHTNCSLLINNNNNGDKVDDDEFDGDGSELIDHQQTIPIQFQSQKKKKKKKQMKRRKQKEVQKENQILIDQNQLYECTKNSTINLNNQQQEGTQLDQGLLLDEVRFNYPICFSKNLWKAVSPEKIFTYQVDSNYIQEISDISFNFHRLSEARNKIFKKHFTNFDEAIDDLVRIPRFRERTIERKLNSNSPNVVLSQSRSIERRIFNCTSHNFSYILEKKENTLHLLIYDSARNTVEEYLNFEKLFYLNGKHGIIKVNLDFNSDYKISKINDSILIFCGDLSMNESEYLEQAEVENNHLGNDRYVPHMRSASMIIYKIHKVDKPSEICILPCFSANNMGRDNYLTKRRYYTVSSTNGSLIYVFGGIEKHNGQLSNSLYSITRSTTQYNRLECLLQNNECAPCPRYKHSSCMIVSDLFIYGGIGERGKLLNDLYRFKEGKWSEIIVDSLLPSPHADCSLFSDSRNVYLFHNSNDGYCIQVNEKNPQWRMLNGLIKEKRKDKEIQIESSSSIFKLNDDGLHFCPKYLFDFRSERTSLSQFLMEKKKENYLVDMAFKLEDSLNDLSDYILVHKCVILARCPGMCKYIEETNQELEREEFYGVVFPNDGKATIPLVRVLPGFEPVFKTYLDFLYCGDVIVEEANNVPLLLDLAKILSPDCHYPFFLKLFNKNTKIDMSLCRESLKNYKEDFETLFKNVVEFDLSLVFPDSHPNIELDDCGMVADQETIPPGALNVHRLFLSRSPYLSRVFVTSRMSESISKIVFMEEYSCEAFKKVVEFFYTDKIQLDGQNCLATLIYSSLFECEDLLSCSRSVATELIDCSTIWSVFGIALHYQDPGLQISCEDFLLKNDSLVGTRDFNELPKYTKRRIKEQLKKKKPNKKK